MSPGPSKVQKERRREQPQVEEGTLVEKEGVSPPKLVEIPSILTVKELSDLLQISGVEVIKQLMRNGVFANITQVIDFDTAAIVASDFGFEVKEKPVAEVIAARRAEKRPLLVEDPSLLKPRPPVVTMLGHVDHGKTALLDAIRKSNITAQEAGGITQHIGAYQVDVRNEKITFLDTPGHEAFTAMRARGAKVTDVAVLVVAADDGVMPQTIEAINHAKAAGVPIVVAINKIDKPEANPEKVKRQLADHGILVEEWGGDVIAVPVSAKTKEGIPELLESILLVAEVSELKANPNRPAAGTVIEAKLDATRGPVATILVQTGTLQVGDNVVVGEMFGRIKAMFTEGGKRVKRAVSSTPVGILGINGVPQAGDTLIVVADDRTARALFQERQKEKERQARQATRPRTLEQILAQIRAGEIKELNIILKTDVQGSIEPIKSSLERLQTEKARVKIIHSGSGNVTESDVFLAVASKAMIIGFNNRVEPGGKRLAGLEGVDIRFYNIIYNLVEDVKKALQGLLEPVYEEVIEGHAEVRAIFPVRQGKIAGVYVTDGKIVRGSKARVIRKGETIHEFNIISLRHFKEDVRDLPAGFEGGVGLEDFGDFEVGDIIEAYTKERSE